jgi:hypothetical protein
LEEQHDNESVRKGLDRKELTGFPDDNHLIEYFPHI